MALSEHYKFSSVLWDDPARINSYVLAQYFEVILAHDHPLSAYLFLSGSTLYTPKTARTKLGCYGRRG